MSETTTAPVLTPEQIKQKEFTEAMEKPITPEILNDAKNKLGLAVNCLLSPPGQYGRSGDKSFYANLLMRMNLQYTNKVPTAGVSVTDRVNFYVNPHFLLTLNIAEQMELIIHECEHIMLLHPLRSKKMGITSKNDHKLFNIAADANINIPLTVLTQNLGVTIERLNKQLAEQKSKYRISEDDHAEVHYEKLKLIQQEMKEQGLGTPDGMGEDGDCDDHGSWEESSENEELAKAVVKEAANKAAEATGAGNIPAHMAKELAKMNSASVNWKKEMQQFAMRTIKFSRERTRAKRNRRHGWMQQGSRKKPEVKIAVCCDSSGSVSDASWTQFFAEIHAISAMGIQITIIDADCGVAAVYEYDKKKPLKRYGNGGTAYAPAINKAKELKVDGIIYFGDMDSSDTPTDPKIPFLWAIVGNQNPPAKFKNHREVRVIEQK